MPLTTSFPLSKFIEQVDSFMDSNGVVYWSDIIGIPIASAFLQGIIDIADSNGAVAGTNDSKAMTPKKVKLAIDANVPIIPDASTSVKGKIQIADSNGVVVGTDDTTAITPKKLTTKLTPITPIGLHCMAVDASEMIIPASSTASAATIQGAGSGNPTYSVIDFDQSTAEFVQFKRFMPSSWDGGNIKFQIIWTANSGTGDTNWAFQAYCAGDNATSAGAFTATSTVIDTYISNGFVHITSLSNNISIAGTVGPNSLLFFRLFRNATVSTDTLNADARLLQVLIWYSKTKGTD